MRSTRPGPGHGRRAEGGQRPPRHRDEPRPGGVPAVPEGHAPRPGRPRLDRPATASCSPAGHSSLTLYSQLYLGGFGLELDDLKSLRVWGSSTPGHPEHGHTAGVETTTGPLGQGVANARRDGDGRTPRAWAPRPRRGGRREPVRPLRLRHLQRRRPAGGCQRRGLLARRATSSSATSWSSTTTTGSRSRTTPRIAFSEDVAARYEAYGWHVQTVDWTNGGKGYAEDVHGAVGRHPGGQGRDRPAQLHQAAHDHRLAGAQRPEHRQGARLRPRRGRGRGHQGGPGLRPGADLRGQRRGPRAHPRPARRGHRPAARLAGAASTAWADGEPRPQGAPRPAGDAPLPDGWTDALPSFEADAKGVATRKASGEVLSAIAPVLPELWGGSADLAGVQQHHPQGRALLHARRARPPTSSRATSYGRVLHFGIREHAMGSIMNGIALHGGTRVYGGTFLVFSDYMRPAVRLAALMKLPGDLRVDPRLDRPRRGRPHAPAGRAPRRAARHPRPGRRPSRGRQRDRGRLADRPRAHRPARGAVPDPPERADLPARDRRLRERRRASPRAATCCSTPRRTPTSILVGTGSEVRSPSRPASSSPRRASRPGWSRCRAGSGSTPRTRPTATASCPARQRAGQRRGRRRPGLARDRRRPRTHRVAGPLRRQRAVHRAVRQVRPHGRRRRLRGRGQHPRRCRLSSPTHDRPARRRHGPPHPTAYA